MSPVFPRPDIRLQKCAGSILVLCSGGRSQAACSNTVAFESINKHHHGLDLIELPSQCLFLHNFNDHDHDHDDDDDDER